MRKLPLSYGLLSCLDDLEYAEAALAADPDTSSHAEPFRDAIEEWDGHFKKERAARREVTRAEAIVAVRNERLDLLTTRFASAVRAFAAELVGKMFGGVTPGQFVRKGLRGQCEKTRDVILPEIAKLGASHSLAPFSPELDAGAKSAIAALDDRAKAKGAKQVLTNDIDEWKEGINDLRTTTYAELLKIAVAKKYPKSWVESFFRRADAPGEDSTADDGAETAEAAPT